MARTELSAIATPSLYGKTPSTLTWTAADIVNKNQTPITGREILLARNADGASAHNVTVSSVALNNRTGDATKAIPANGYVLFQQFPTEGWQQSDGNLYFEGDNANIEFAVVQLP